MLSVDRLTDEAQEIRKAFPSGTAKSMRLKLWDVIRAEDWGFRTVDGMTNWTGRDSSAGDVAFWMGADGCLMWLVCAVFIVPPVWVRNQFAKPVYERRIAIAIDGVVSQRAR
jgi:hypothetical protein